MPVPTICRRQHEDDAMTETSPSFDAACASAQKAVRAIDAAHAEIAAEARLSEENRGIAILQSRATRNGVVPPIESIAVPPSQINIEVIV
jgi:hypothetical protein